MCERQTVRDIDCMSASSSVNDTLPTVALSTDEVPFDTHKSCDNDQTCIVSMCVCALVILMHLDGFVCACA